MDLCNDISLLLGISFEGFIIIHGHGLHFPSIWGQVQVVVVSLNESLAQILESFDINLVQTHVPYQSGTRQTHLETMDEKLIITYLSRHLFHLHRQMILRASVPFVFFKVGDLELGRNHDIWN